MGRVPGGGSDLLPRRINENLRSGTLFRFFHGLAGGLPEGAFFLYQCCFKSYVPEREAVFPFPNPRIRDAAAFPAAPGTGCVYLAGSLSRFRMPSTDIFPSASFPEGR